MTVRASQVIAFCFAEGWVDRESAVRTGECAGWGSIQLRCHGPAVADRGQVDVLAETSVWEMGPSERGATDEMDPVAEFTAQKGE